MSIGKSFQSIGAMAEKALNPYGLLLSILLCSFRERTAHLVYLDEMEPQDCE